MKKLILRVKEEVSWFIYLAFFLNKYSRRVRKSYDSLIFLGTPCYGNLGDQGIAYATYKFLQKYVPEKRIIEIPIGFIEKHTFVFKILLSNQKILICGGGFIGSQWKWGNDMICKAVNIFPKNPIIILPQTLYFENNQQGRDCLEKVRRIYGSHKNLVICCRERQSYWFAQREFKANRALLVPDMVTFLNQEPGEKRREGIALLFRDDCEKKIDSQWINSLVKQFKATFCESAVETDNLVPEFIRPSYRGERVEKRLEELSRYRMVITDRLHGMLFAAVTGTPCLALANGNGKIKGVYETIKNNPYIVFSDGTESEEMLVKKFESILNGRYSFDNQSLKEYFNQLGEEVRSSGEKYEEKRILL